MNTPSTCGVCVHLDLPAAPFRTPTSNGGVQTPKRSPSPHAPILKLVTRNHQVRGSPKTPVILQVEEPGAVCKEKKKHLFDSQAPTGPHRRGSDWRAARPAGRSVGSFFFLLLCLLTLINEPSHCRTSLLRTNCPVYCGTRGCKTNGPEPAFFAGAGR